MAEARQSPGAAVAQAASVSTSAANPAEEQEREAAEPDAAKAAASLPEVLLVSGEERKHYTSPTFGF